jgi:hypothetical protein
MPHLFTGDAFVATVEKAEAERQRKPRRKEGIDEDSMLRPYICKPGRCSECLQPFGERSFRQFNSFS